MALGGNISAGLHSRSPWPETVSDRGKTYRSTFYLLMPRAIGSGVSERDFAHRGSLRGLAQSRHTQARLRARIEALLVRTRCDQAWINSQHRSHAGAVDLTAEPYISYISRPAREIDEMYGREKR